MATALERNEHYITYEFVGNMLRNSRGPVPRNNVVMDTVWGMIGAVRQNSPFCPLLRRVTDFAPSQVAFPFWRIFEADAAVRAEAKKLKLAAK